MERALNDLHAIVSRRVEHRQAADELPWLAGALLAHLAQFEDLLGGILADPVAAFIGFLFLGEFQ